ncbi:MAG: hypothetical protein ACE1ZQ_11645 [Ignavibacteriaceae bacterium]
MGTFLYRLAFFIGFMIIIFILIFGYFFFEPFLTKTEEVITVINIERWGDEEGKYFIFTDDEVFINVNDYYHNKDNADEIFTLFKLGYTYRVKVVGVYMPSIPRFRNIINIIEYSTNEYFPDN